MVYLRHSPIANANVSHVNGISERPGLFEFSIAWQAEKPLEGDLWAIHTTEHGKVKNRIHAAAFKAKGGRYLPSGFKLLRFRPDGKKLSGLVKLVFIEPGSKPPESILDCNPWDGSLSTVWASQSRPSHEFVFQNGLVVNIDRVEMRSNVLVVNLRWKSQQAVDGLLFFREFDEQNQPVRVPANQFLLDDPIVRLSGEKQFLFDFEKTPKTEKIDLSFGRKGKGLVLFDSNHQEDPRRILIWNKIK